MMESAGNPTGSNLHKLRYTHDLGLAIYLDLDKLLGLKHTYFLVTASQRVGNNLSSDIPNFFQVQQEFGHPTMRLDNLAIEQQLLDGRLDVVAGRIKATSDFAYSWVSCYSQNLGLCDFRLGAPYNASISSHPYSVWGIRARYDLTPEIYSMTGVYNTYADFRDIKWYGADFSIRHNSEIAPFQEFGTHRITCKSETTLELSRSAASMTRNRSGNLCRTELPEPGWYMAWRSND
jgi:carbohydrate-selective porin OprB